MKRIDKVFRRRPEWRTAEKPVRVGPRARIAREGAWLAGAQLVGASAALVSIRILTELLVPEEFGRLTLIVGLSGLMFALSIRPMLQSTLRFYADWKQRGTGEALRSGASIAMLAVGALVSLILMIAAFLFAPGFGENWTVGLAIAALFATESVRTFEQDFFNAARRQMQAALVLMADACLRPLGAVVAVTLWNPTADAAVLGYVAGSLVVVTSTWWFSQREGAATSVLSRGLVFLRDPSLAEERSRLSQYAIPLVPVALLIWFNGLGERYIIGGILGLAEAGLYAGAYGLVSRPFLMLGTATEMLMRPILIEAVASQDSSQRRTAKRIWLQLVVAGSVIGLVSFYMLAGLVSEIFLARDYRQVEDLMRWIALGYLFYNVSSVYMGFCFVFNEPRAVLTASFATSATMILILAPLLERHGLLGAALATPIYYGIQALVSRHLARSAERKYVVA